MRLELPAADHKCDVAKFLVLEKLPEIIGQPAFRHFELYRVTLPGNVDTIRYYTDLKGRKAYQRGRGPWLETKVRRDRGTFV